MRAAAGWGGRSLLQDSQLGRSSNTLVHPDAQRLGIRARRRRPGLDRGVVLRALASIEHAVVPDDAHDPMADAGTDGRTGFLPRGPVTPRGQQRELPPVVDSGQTLVASQG